jgi:nucleotide-binding universal stress UspA family protein
MIRNILVPLDGSPFGETCLSLAASIAARTGATLRLAHVHTIQAQMAADWVVMDAFAYDEETRRDEKAYLVKTAKRLSELDVHAVAELLEGEIIESLRRCVTANKVDLVVASTHGRGPFSRFWLGSVADALVRTLSTPILLQRPTGGETKLTRDVALNRILVTLDERRHPLSMLQPALELGEAMKSEFRLFTVVAPPPAYGLGAPEPSGIAAITSKLEGVARDHLAELGAKLRESGKKVEETVVIRPDPAVGILEAAATCDAVAIATHGRGGVERMLIGSVADKVLRGSEKPLLLYRIGADGATLNT